MKSLTFIIYFYLISFVSIFVCTHLHNEQPKIYGKLLKHELTKVPTTIADCKTYRTTNNENEKICSLRDTHEYTLTRYYTIENQTITLVENCIECLDKLKDKIKETVMVHKNSDGKYVLGKDDFYMFIFLMIIILDFMMFFIFLDSYYGGIRL